MTQDAIAQMAWGTLVQIGLSVALYMWGKSIARRRTGAFWRRMAWVPLVALVMTLVGMFTTIWLLVQAFGAVATADPSMKATLLAKSISYAMNFTAILVVPAIALYIFSAVTFAIGWLRATD